MLFRWAECSSLLGWQTESGWQTGHCSAYPSPINTHSKVSVDYLIEAISVHQRLQLQLLFLLGEARSPGQQRHEKCVSIDLQVQSKACLESMHHLALARLASLLEQEVWAVADVPLHCQRIVDDIFYRAGQQSNLPPGHTDDGHAGKAM